MNILSASASNFGSYKNLTLNFNKGLTLVHGSTGSGKSTLCDVIPWVLFGRTSKDTSVDEVRKWGESDPTIGYVHLADFSVCRIRGKSNDLFMFKKILGETHEIRGKDMPDTQKLINAKLGYDLTTYLAGAYINEFSQVAQFFTTTAKNRRAILEQVADLSFAKDLQSKTAAKLKISERTFSELTATVQYAQNLLHAAQDRHDKAYMNFIDWSKKLNVKIADLAEKQSTYDTRISNMNQILVAQIEDLTQIVVANKPKAAVLNSAIKNLESNLQDDICKECGAHKDNPIRIEIESQNRTLSKLIATMQLVEKELKHKQADLTKLLASENTYQEQLDNAYKQINPYKNILAESQEELYNLTDKIKQLNTDIALSATAVQDLGTLTDVLNNLRAYIVKNTINSIESKANKYLNDYFDAEIRISLQIEEADKIEIKVTKDGNICSFAQLSKGQRQLIKLSFGVAVMQAVSNHHGLDFNTIMIDEALDGLSEQFKIKAYGLLQELALQYENVFVVEHSSELKNMFLNSIEVRMVESESIFNEEI